MKKHLKVFFKGKELDIYNTDKSVFLEITQFQANGNAVGYARNGMNNVLDLVTTRYDCWWLLCSSVFHLILDCCYMLLYV